MVAARSDDGRDPADDRAIASVVVDGLAPVEADVATVVTPCFSYRAPEDLELDRRSAGCATAVGFGSDSLTQIRVQAQSGGAGEDIDEVAADFRRSTEGRGEYEIDTVSVGDRDAVRIRSVDGWGIRRTSYLVPLPAGRFTQAGKVLGSIWLTSPASPEFDDWMATVVGSLEIPGD